MRVEFHVLRRVFILSRAEAPEEPVHGDEYHASPLVGLQVPLVLVVLVSLVSLPDDSGAEEEEEAGIVSTGLGCRIATGGVEETA